MGEHAGADPRRRGCPDRTPTRAPGLQIDTTIFQAADFIDLAIHNLTRALIIGSLLVLLVIGLFLFEWRTALISLIAIPLSLLAAALVCIGAAPRSTPWC